MFCKAKEDKLYDPPWPNRKWRVIMGQRLGYPYYDRKDCESLLFEHEFDPANLSPSTNFYNFGEGQNTPRGWQEFSMHKEKRGYCIVEWLEQVEPGGPPDLAGRCEAQG